MADGEVQAQIAALTGGDVRKAAAAAESLTHMGPDAQPAAVALVRACGAADETVRAWAAAALEELGPPAPQQIGDLVALINFQSTDVAYWAITLLGRAGHDASPAVESLAEIVRNSHERALRERAAWALGNIGPAAAAAAPVLHEAAASGPPRLVRLAQAALDSITAR